MGAWVTVTDSLRVAEAPSMSASQTVMVYGWSALQTCWPLMTPLLMTPSVCAVSSPQSIRAVYVPYDPDASRNVATVPLKLLPSTALIVAAVMLRLASATTIEMDE